MTEVHQSGEVSALRSICVYCGSGAGYSPVYRDAADAFGRACAARGIRVVFGGGSIGLMGALATAAREAGGTVTGIIPQHLRERELADEAVDELLVVDTMHARKQRMAERSDGFCVLPGGIGTLDETIEILTWKQLGLHAKPVVLLDTEGFWEPLIRLFDHQRAAGFLGEPEPKLFRRAHTVERALALLEQAASGSVPADAGLDRT